MRINKIAPIRLLFLFGIMIFGTEAFGFEIMMHQTEPVEADEYYRSRMDRLQSPLDVKAWCNVVVLSGIIIAFIVFNIMLYLLFGYKCYKIFCCFKTKKSNHPIDHDPPIVCEDLDKIDVLL